MANSNRTIATIFAAPVTLAILSAVGLIVALFGDGPWDVLSWLTLSSPIAVAAYFVLKQGARG